MFIKYTAIKAYNTEKGINNEDEYSGKTYEDNKVRKGEQNVSIKVQVHIIPLRITLMCDNSLTIGFEKHKINDY